MAKAANQVYKVQYAIKFTYRFVNSNFPLNPPYVYGSILTQVSIHNFNNKLVKVRKKLAAPDRISPFLVTAIKPDAVEEVNYINLPDFDYPFPPTGFFDGFLVIESDAFLDVVITYTNYQGEMKIVKAEGRTGSWS